MKFFRRSALVLFSLGFLVVCQGYQNQSPSHGFFRVDDSVIQYMDSLEKESQVQSKGPNSSEPNNLL